jgi:hypothetical protein
MALPQAQERRQERREMRYPLHLPVLIRMARKEMRARSENISLGGILLSSDCLIPEGTTVEVAVGVEHTPDPGILLSARGQVLRAQPTGSGDFALAIRLERSFQLPLARPMPPGAILTKADTCTRRDTNTPVFYRAPYVSGWHTET